MKNLFFLFLCLILFNCSSNNDDTNEVLIETFLEKYEGTGWLNDDSPYYYWFINDESTPIEQWYLGGVGGDCLEVGLIDIGNFEITENSENKFVLSAVEAIGTTTTHTYTIIGDNLEQEHKRDIGEGLEINIYTFTRVTENVDDFTFCD
jgi:hypothetical protein